MKKGFTLAEVLLTLAIIGVVAALTIPAVVTKTTKQQYVTGLKKAYNTMKQVEREAIQGNGEIANWDWEGTQTDFAKFFKPHMNILKDCGMTTDAGCFADNYKGLDGVVLSTGGQPNARNNYKVITADGISFSYTTVTTYQGVPVTDSRKAYMMVDVNGRKGPNIRGRDFFSFEVWPEADRGILPGGKIYTNGRSIPSTSANTACLSTGSYCTAKVLAEGAMNY